MALDLENERKYLQGLMSQNNPGLADWAQNRSKELGISLQAPSAGAQPGTASGGAPSTYMADINQALQAYRASGLLGNRGNVSVQQYTPRPANVPSRQQLMGQAQSEVNPWVQRQKEDSNRLYEDLRKRLPALLNARGQMTGGLRNAFEQRLTEQQDRALGGINLQAEERVAQLVNALQQRAEEQAYRQQQADYQQYLGGQQLGLQAEDMNRQGERDTFGNLMSIANYGRGAMESDRTYGRDVLESDRTYGRGVLEGDRSFDLQYRTNVGNMTGVDPVTLQPTLAAQQINFGQGIQTLGVMLDIAQAASQQAGVVTPEYATLLGRPELAGQQLASIKQAEQEQQNKLQEIAARGSWDMKLAKERNNQPVDPAQQAKNAIWTEFIETGGAGMTPEKLKVINAYVPKEDTDAYSQDVKGYIGWVSEGRFGTPGTPEAVAGATAEIDSRVRAGLMPSGHGEALKAGLNAYFTPPSKPSTATTSQDGGFWSNLLRPMTQEEQTNTMLTPSF